MRERSRIDVVKRLGLGDDILGRHHGILGVGAVPAQRCASVYVVAALESRHAGPSFFNHAGYVQPQDGRQSSS